MNNIEQLKKEIIKFGSKRIVKLTLADDFYIGTISYNKTDDTFTYNSTPHQTAKKILFKLEDVVKLSVNIEIFNNEAGLWKI